MPIIVPTPISNQITPSGNAPYTQQYNFGQAIGQLVSWNPNIDSGMVSTILNESLRKVIDRRTWWSLMTKGQIVTPPFYQAGTVSCTLGSQIITGSGTNWNSSMVGMSLRVGYTAPIYNIISVQSPTQLTIELPWGLTSVSTIGYYITGVYYSIPNILYLYSLKNLQLFYRIWTNVPQTFLENVDPSRLRLIYPWVCATMPPDTNGNYQVELWPAPMTQQALPYLAYVQPPNLVNDEDNFPPFFRGDVIVAGAVAQALRYRTKDNPYYSESVALAIAAQKDKEFEAGIQAMELRDENLFRKDVLSFAEQFPYLDPVNGTRMGGYDAMQAIEAVPGGGDAY